MLLDQHCLTGEFFYLFIADTKPIAIIFLDRNRNAIQDGSDPGIGGVDVRLAYRGTTTPILVETTDFPGGNFRFDEVPVGTYWMTVDSVILGDSFQIVQADTTPVNVLPAIGTSKSYALAFPHLTIAEARLLPPGRKVSVEGFVLNDREQMYEAASVYDPNVPAHENVEYVETTKKYLRRYEEAMRGNSAAFGSRLDRGWVPPSLDDLEAEIEQAEEEQHGNSNA